MPHTKILDKWKFTITEHPDGYRLEAFSLMEGLRICHTQIHHSFSSVDREIENFVRLNPGGVWGNAGCFNWEELSNNLPCRRQRRVGDDYLLGPITAMASYLVVCCTETEGEKTAKWLALGLLYNWWAEDIQDAEIFLSVDAAEQCLRRAQSLDIADAMISIVYLNRSA